MKPDSPLLQKDSSLYPAQLATRKLPLHLHFLQSGAQVSDLVNWTTAPEIAFVGRSNVGKSSLLNFIAGQKQLARVSSLPGRTQLINLFEADGGAFQMADLPGYGFALSPREVQHHWSTEMARYFEARTNLKGVLFLVDARRDIDPDDVRLCRWFLSLGLNVLAVQTKCDKIHKSQIKMIKQKQAVTLGLSAEAFISTSSDKKIGLQDLFVGIAGLLAAAQEDALAAQAMQDAQDEIL